MISCLGCFEIQWNSDGILLFPAVCDKHFPNIHKHWIDIEIIIKKLEI